jgi:hypothetical protein
MSNSLGTGVGDLVDARDGDESGNSKHGIWRRGPWQTASTVLIVGGILMLVQPFALALYTYSFSVILAGGVAFVITSHFPE